MAIKGKTIKDKSVECLAVAKSDTAFSILDIKLSDYQAEGNQDTRKSVCLFVPDVLLC